jgi:hypothetical protein
MYDVIGDIHGHADALQRLLVALGYARRGSCWRHPDRTAVFLGDFIDRGPAIREVLEIVRPMVEEGAALAVMGNHEMNAIGYHTPHPRTDGAHLRERSPKNVRQHAATVQQLGSEEALRDAVAWFRTLPFWLERDGLRVVHACWALSAMRAIEAALARCGGATPEFLHAAFERGEPLYQAVEVVLKGKEASLPNGLSYRDADGHQRREVRTRWWAGDRDGWTWRDAALVLHDDVRRQLPDGPVDAGEDVLGTPYPPDAPPLFFGHYWMRPQDARPLAGNVACLDFSVARGGRLGAYRWEGEGVLRAEGFVTVGA